MTSRENTLRSSAERLHSEPSRPARPRHRVLVFAAPLVPLLAVAAVWCFTDLRALNSPDEVAEAARALRENPIAPAYVLAAFGVGTAVFFPVTALVLGTILAFDPLRGVIFALLGALLGVTTTYWGGRLLGSRALEYVSGPRVAKFSDELRTRAFRAGIIARLLPVGNFTAINLLAGSMRIPFRAFFLGNVLGLLPSMVLFGVFADRITSAVQTPNRQNLTMLAVGALVLVALVVLQRRWSKRRASAEEDARR